MRRAASSSGRLAFGGLLLVGGRISDLFGRNPTLIARLIGFAAASAVGGTAQRREVLAGARALQGAFGALLAPTALSLLSTTFSDPGERGKAFGIYGAVAGSGADLWGSVDPRHRHGRWLPRGPSATRLSGASAEALRPVPARVRGLGSRSWQRSPRPRAVMPAPAICPGGGADVWISLPVAPRSWPEAGASPDRHRLRAP
jgi:MFS family permease